MKTPLALAIALTAAPALAADSASGLYGLVRFGLGYTAVLKAASGEGAGGRVQREGPILDPGSTSFGFGWGYSGLNLQLDLLNVLSPAGSPTVGTLEVGLRLKASLGPTEGWARFGVGYAFQIDRDQNEYFGTANVIGFAGTTEFGLDFFVVENTFAVGPALIGQIHASASPATIMFDGQLTLNAKLLL